MTSHLYYSTLGRVRWFIKRFGISEVFFKPVRQLFAPLIIPRLPPSTFKFWDQTHQCFYAPYNTTWIGERMVEIPIIRAAMTQRPQARVLEVGNVLSHYFRGSHEIVDKFETGQGVINQDILEYYPTQDYDLIISISTFEHIGFDDETSTSSGEKILAALDHCRRLLAPGGQMLVTFPTGYNPQLDELLTSGRLGAVRCDYLRRVGKRQWETCSLEEALGSPYRAVFPYGNALVVAEFHSNRENG